MAQQVSPPPRKRRSLRSYYAYWALIGAGIILVAIAAYAFWYVPTREAFGNYRALETLTNEERVILDWEGLSMTPQAALPSKTIVEEYGHYGIQYFISTVRDHHRVDVYEVKETHSDIFFGTATFSVFYFSDDGQMWILNCDQPWHPLKSP